MPIPSPTRAELEAAEIMQRRGERVLAEEAKVRAELEAKAAADREAAENPQPVNPAIPKIEINTGRKPRSCPSPRLWGWPRLGARRTTITITRRSWS